LRGGACQLRCRRQLAVCRTKIAIYDAKTPIDQWLMSLVLFPCYDAFVFNFGKPKTLGDWIVHIAGAIVAIFLVWWMLRVYVL
jgi:hypothetical protein